MLYHKIIPIEYIHSCLRIVQAVCEGITYGFGRTKEKRGYYG